MGQFEDETINACVERAKAGGGEVVKLMGTSAYYAPASGSVQMAEAIIKDKKRILPCAAHLTGQYGVRDLYLGVPVVIGANGVERIVEIKLDATERSMFRKSVGAVKGLVALTQKLQREASKTAAPPAKKVPTKKAAQKKAPVKKAPTKKAPTRRKLATRK